MTRQERLHLKNGLLFAAPWIVGFCVFTFAPILASFYYSLCSYNVVREPIWIGLENYRTLLFEDPHFLKTLYNTLYMMVFGVPLSLALAFCLAALLNTDVSFLSFFRTVFYLPSVVPVVAVSILWVWILNPEYGCINALLASLGVHGPGWLTDPRWSKPALILTNLWGVGNIMIIFLAGLQQVPRSLYEAAVVDGANRLQRLWNITLPCVSPVIFFNLIMGVIASFQYFTQVYIMTTGISPEYGGRAGGPEGSTLVYALYLYQNAFQHFKMGYASAMAWILFLLSVAVIYVILKTSGWVHYAEEQ
ncbi:MAG TPA: sugar ABC transporter permease [bacterium]|nr:sugar ABC transporter permease [bacterium]HQL62340.1 sugar ABC transporter permease [bacterium]